MLVGLDLQAAQVGGWGLLTVGPAVLWQQGHLPECPIGPTNKTLRPRTVIPYPHRQEFQPQHEPVCEEYASMQRLAVLMREQAAVALFAGNQLPYPMAKVTQLQAAQLLDSWQRYRRLRVPSVTNDDTWK